MSGRTHTCSAGESFDAIALAEYGDEKYAAELLSANPSLCTTPIFSGGETLNLPEIEIPDKEQDHYAPAKAPWKE